jgi:hypothetical protein
VGDQADKKKDREVPQEGEPVHRSQEEHEKSRQQDLGPYISEKAGHAAAGPEGDDEAAQVEGKRQDPDEREGAHLEGYVVRYGKQEGRGQAGKQKPLAVNRLADRCRLGGRLPPAIGCHRSQVRAKQNPRGDDKGGIENVGQAPGHTLQLYPHERLRHEGVAEQGDERACIGSRIEGVGFLVPAHPGMGQPRLRHDGRCRQHGERQCHVKGKDIEQVPERGVRVGLCIDLERQIHQGEGKDSEVPHAQFSCEEVSVEIPDEQNGLEEHQAGEPHMGRTAEEGRQQPARQGLESEEQDGPREDHARQDDHGPPVVSSACRFFRLHSSTPPKAVLHTAFLHDSSSGFFGKKQQATRQDREIPGFFIPNTPIPSSCPQGCR